MLDIYPERTCVFFQILFEGSFICTIQEKTCDHSLAVSGLIQSNVSILILLDANLQVPVVKNFPCNGWWMEELDRHLLTWSIYHQRNEEIIWSDFPQWIQYVSNPQTTNARYHALSVMTENKKILLTRLFWLWSWTKVCCRLKLGSNTSPGFCGYLL